MIGRRGFLAALLALPFVSRMLPRRKIDLSRFVVTAREFTYGEGCIVAPRWSFSNTRSMIQWRYKP